MATPIIGPSRVSSALVARQPVDASPAQPDNVPASANPIATVAHSKHSEATRLHAHAGGPTAEVSRDSLTSPAANTAGVPQVESARLHAAKQLLDQIGLSGPAAQTFFDKQVERILADAPAQLESWLAGWILAANHNASSASAPAKALDPLTPESTLALLAQQPCNTVEQRVELATLVALPDAELRQRLDEATGRPARPAA